MKKIFLFVLLATGFISVFAQDQVSTAPITWKASSQKMGEKIYQLIYTSNNEDGWDIYNPNSKFEDISAAFLELSDSSIRITTPLNAEGTGVTEKSVIFENASFEVFKGKTTFTATVEFTGEIPAVLNTKLSFTYGKADEFFPGETAELSIKLEGGKAVSSRIRIPSINPDQPLQDCGISEEKEDNSILNIFLLGVYLNKVLLF